jgi:hypothetical protein
VHSGQVSQLYIGAHARLVQKGYVSACAAEQKLQLQLPVSYGALSTVVKAPDSAAGSCDLSRRPQFSHS